MANVRDFLGWLVGRRVVDVTQGDPPAIPDSDAEDAHYLVLHFDNGGTLAVGSWISGALDVPITDEGFSFSNPAAEAANRGELCQECQAGRRKLANLDLDRLLPDASQTRGLSACLRAYRQAVSLPRDYHEDSHVITDDLIAHAEQYPWQWKPQNPHYQKNYVNAPGTVRSWFRKMRAADFERDVERVSVGARGHFFIVWPELRGWSLFDTQSVVNRETAAHYADLATIYLMRDGDVVGVIRDVAIERGTYQPLFQSTVPTATGVLTLEAIKKWIDACADGAFGACGVPPGS